MANEIFNESEFLQAIDQSKLSEGGKLEFAKRIADIEKKKALAAAELAYDTIKTHYQEKGNKLAAKLNVIPIPRSINIIETWLTKNKEKKVFDRTIDDMSIKWCVIKDVDGNEVQTPVFCNMLLDLASYEKAQALIDELLSEEYGKLTIRSLVDKADFQDTKSKIITLLNSTGITIDDDLNDDINLSYFVNYEHGTELAPKGWTVTVKQSRASDKKEKTPSAPKLDADGNPIKSKKEMAPEPYKNWDTCLADQPAGSYLAILYAKVSQAEKDKGSGSYYVKSLIAKEKNMPREDVVLNDYIGK